MQQPIRIAGRKVADVMADLNRAIEAEGIEFGEYGFGSSTYADSIFPTEDELDRWRFSAWPHRGTNEGYYVHLDIMRWYSGQLVAVEFFQPAMKILERPVLSLSSAKTWDWDSAARIAEAAARLLGAGPSDTRARVKLAKAA